MKYSIITINYNNRDGLERTIQSVINQTYQDFEYIIIDGGSTDGSVDIIKKYADRIDYWVSEPDKGIYNAMNKGILQSHGEYIIFLNSGDYFYDFNVLDNVIVYLKSDVSSGKILKQCHDHTWNFENNEITMMQFYCGSIPHPASFIRRELFNDCLYNDNYRIVSDWEFFIKKIIFANCSYNYIPIIISVFDDNGISSTNCKLNNCERITVLKSILPQRILADYEKFKDKESPVLYLIPEFNHTYRLEKLIYWMIKIVLKIYKLVK